MTHRRFLLGLAHAAAVLSAPACATPQQVRVVRNDVRALRAERAQADSALRRELARVSASLAAAHDSLVQLSQRATKFQGDVRGDLYALGQQLIQIQELTGQSQRRIQELRVELEKRAQEIAAQPPVPPSGDTSAARTPATGPGPNQLYQLSMEQLRRGSAAAARAGFEDLLRQYPTADIAPEAQYYLGEAYSAEGNRGAADSAYARVVSQYPNSARAPSALYKIAQAHEASGRVAQARAALTQIVQRYPRSDEADLARERLKTLR